MYSIGYDIGSSHIKVALVHLSSHEVVGITQHPAAEMEIISRQKGWAEQQPELWWKNVCKATRKILESTGVKPDMITSIGISYQMHGLVLIDAYKNVLRPSIIWCDSRAVSIGNTAFSDLGINYCLNNYLNSPGNFTASKLKWIKDNEPDIYQRIDKILLPGEYIAMRFSGEICTSILGLTEGIFWNFKNKKLAHEILDYFELDEGIIPPVKGTFDIMGEVSPEAASESGLVSGTPISYRAGDQPNNAMSLNVLNNGEVAATSGTSGVVYGVVDHLMYDKQSRVNAFAHVNYEEDYSKLGLLLCINGAGIQYAWMKNQIARMGRAYKDMERMVQSVSVGSEGICILPFGNGAERMFDNANVESHIFNLEFNRHSRAHLFRASLEGIAFSFVYGINMMKEMGLEINRLKVANDNMFQSKVFSETIATLLDMDIELVNTTGAVGAARAAGVGSGRYNSLEEALQSVSYDDVYQPSLDYASCSKAYDFWSNNLKNVLTRTASSDQKKNEDYINLKKKLESKTRKLENKSLRLNERDTLINTIANILNTEQGDTNTPAIINKLSKIEALIKRNKPNGKSVEDQEALYDSDVVLFFKRSYPLLTYQDLKLIYFLYNKLTTKEISSRIGLSVRGVETLRYRLRKKINIDRGQNLTTCISRIYGE